MKKKILRVCGLVSTVMILSLSACSANQEESKAPETTAKADMNEDVSPADKASEEESDDEVGGAEIQSEVTAEGSESDVDVTEIRIQHAFGETVLEKKPERVVTIAWENGDTPLALGIVPVGISESNYGAETKNHLHAWTDEAFSVLGVDTPNVFDDTAGWDYEAIADTNPDVILCAYSGLSQEEYDRLSQIAPTVPYKEKPWQTTWRDQTIENARALGMEEEGKNLVDQTDVLIKEKLKDYPSIAGKKTAFCWVDASDMSTFYIYLNTDPRAAYLEDLGLAVPDSVKALTENADDFSITVSRENTDQLNDVEMMIVYGDQSLLDAMQADELMKQIPAVRDGAVVLLDSTGNLAAGTTPSILSIPYNLDEYLSVIDEAAKKVQ